MVQSCSDLCTIHASMDLALNTRAFMANYQPRTMHISWKNKGIPRMWTDFAKTPLYTKKVPLTTPPRVVCRGSNSIIITRGSEELQGYWKLWSSRILHYFFDYQNLSKCLFYFNEQILPYGLFGQILMWQPHFQEKGWFFVICNEHEQIL